MTLKPASTVPPWGGAVPDVTEPGCGWRHARRLPIVAPMPLTQRLHPSPPACAAPSNAWGPLARLARLARLVRLARSAGLEGPLAQATTAQAGARARQPRSGTVELPADGTAVMLTLRRPMQVRASGGRVWITRPGWPQDHWLDAGESLSVTPAGHWRPLHLIVSGEDNSGITLKLEPIV